MTASSTSLQLFLRYTVQTQFKPTMAAAGTTWSAWLRVKSSAYKIIIRLDYGCTTTQQSASVNKGHLGDHIISGQV